MDPDPKNVKAIALYERLGFQKKEMPDYLIADEEEPLTSIYMELSRA